MTHWSQALRQRRHALLQAQRARAVLEARLEQMHCAYLRSPQRFLLMATGSGWLVGRMGISARRIQAATGLVGALAWSALRVLLRKIA